jgi:phosphoglycerol transferase MdoB-like AlkP superfamily enzyme
VRPWDSLNTDEKKLFSRMAEVHAGFSEYTDAQVGRIIDYLEESGQLDNTVVLYAQTMAPPEKAAPTDRSTRTSSSTATLIPCQRT